MSKDNKSQKTASARQRSQKSSEKEVHFKLYAPQAKSVFLSGNFNNWSTAQCPLKKQKEGNWSISIHLPCGQYEYRYLVDGNWVNEPQESTKLVPNAFGTWNCVVDIR